MRFNFLITLLFFFTTINAQWSNDPSENLQVSYSGIWSEACSDGAGGAYVTWLSYDYSNSKVYLQHIDKLGYLSWEQPLLVGQVGNFQIGRTHISPDKEGGVYVAFDQMTPIDTVDGHIVIWDSKGIIQRVGQNATLLWDSLGINVSTDTTQQHQIEIFSENDGNAIVSWGATITPTARFGYFAQKFDKSGQHQWNNKGVLIDTSGSSSQNKIVSDKKEGLIATYQNHKIPYQMLRRIDYTGEISWTDSIYTDYFWIFRNIQNDRKGSAILVIDSDINWPIDQLQAIKIDSNGIFSWGEVGIILSEGERDFDTGGLMTINEKSEPTFIWSDIYDSTKTQFIQTLTVDGQKKWTGNIIIGTDSSNKEVFRVLASNDLSNILLYKKNGDDNIFYAEKIDSSGNIEWSDIIITNDAGGEVSVISDGNGGMVVIWLREYYEGIFAQQISKDGNLGDMVNSVRSKYLSKTPNVFEINHNYPNPFNSSTIIEFNIPRPGKITFNVYTVLGEMIYSKETLFNFPGKNSIQWNSKTTNGKEVNSGIYYFEITFAGMRQTNKAVLIK